MKDFGKALVTLLAILLALTVLLFAPAIGTAYVIVRLLLGETLTHLGWAIGSIIVALLCWAAMFCLVVPKSDDAGPS